MVMPLATLVLVFALDPYLQALPEVFMYMGDLDIRNRKERALPFIIVLAYFIMTYALLVLSPALYIPLVYLDMWMGLMASIGIALLITRWFKISMHMLAQGGVLGTVMAVQAIQLVPAWTLNAVLVFRHIEVYTGYLLGFTVCFCAVVLGLGG